MENSYRYDREKNGNKNYYLSFRSNVAAQFEKYICTIGKILFTHSYEFYFTDKKIFFR